MNTIFTAVFLFFALTQSSSAIEAKGCSTVFLNPTKVNMHYLTDSPDPRHPEGLIEVIRADLGTFESFNRTGRDFDQYGPFFFKDINNKVVLDAGCGSGALVYEMNRLIPSPAKLPNPKKFIGVDIVLGAQQKELIKKNISSNVEPIFYEADMAELPFQSDSFDIIISNFSVFSYLEPVELKVRILSEFRRVLRVGGYVRIGNALGIEQVESLSGLIRTEYVDSGGHGYMVEYRAVPY